MKESADFSPTAAFRKEEQKTFFEKHDVDYRVADLEDDVDTLENAMEGMDAVVFTAGSGASTGLDKTLAVDLDGAVKSMEAAKNAGVDRFVIISAMNAGDRSNWDDSPIKPYLIAKHYADRMLQSLGLDYTILRPGRLFNEDGTGRITLDEPESKRGIPREDVAETVLEVLQNDNTIGKAIAFNEGDTPIQEAVSNI